MLQVKVVITLGGKGQAGNTKQEELGEGALIISVSQIGCWLHRCVHFMKTQPTNL